MNKLTSWFNSSQKPIRPGVYQRRHKYYGFSVFANWNGEKWMVGAESPAMALKENKSSINQLTSFYWRGILK